MSVNMTKLQARVTLGFVFVMAVAVSALALPPAKPACNESPGSACLMMCDDWRAGGGGTFEANCQDCCDAMGRPQTQCYAACGGSSSPTPCTCHP